LDLIAKNSDKVWIDYSGNAAWENSVGWRLIEMPAYTTTDKITDANELPH
jgi:hypothetical protein